MLLPKKCHCIIYSIDEDLFILPDCSAIAKKSDVIFDWYGIEQNKLVLVGIPLSPKLYIEIRNSDIIFPEKNLIHSPTIEQIEQINNDLYNISFSQILLNNPEQLQKLKI